MKQAPFEDDIILVNDNGDIFHLTQDDLGSQFMASRQITDWRTNPKYKRIKSLLENGTAAAALPTYVDTGPEASVATCFLLNCSSLAKKQVDEPGA